ncbi:hypothetical protein [Naasia aerilata]|nr:hypothetical protein [Naasia aerilata]
MSDRTPAPVPATPKPDRVLRLSRILWGLSFVAGVLLLAIAFLRRSRQFELLRGFVSDAEPGYDASTVDTAATVAFWGALAALAVFTVAEILLRGPAERRAGVRWVLLLVLVVHGTVALVGEAFVALAEGAVAFRWLLGAQLVLGAAALAAASLRGRRARRREQDGLGAA